MDTVNISPPQDNTKITFNATVGKLACLKIMQTYFTFKKNLL